MSRSRTHIPAHSHHSHASHRKKHRVEDVESNAAPESVASFVAATVIPGDSVSQIGSRDLRSRPTSVHSHHHEHTSKHSHHHSSRSRSHVDWDDQSSGLLTVENLEAHNAEERSRASTPRPTEQLYVEVLEDRTATGSYHSHIETPQRSLHPNDTPRRSRSSARSPDPQAKALARGSEERLSVSRKQVSRSPSHTSRTHRSRVPELLAAPDRPESLAALKPPTIIVRSDQSQSPAQRSLSHPTSRSPSQSRSHAPISTPTLLDSRASYRSSSKEYTPPRVATPQSREVYEVAVYEEVRRPPSGSRGIYTVEVEAAEDQARTGEYKIHHRHQYPVHGNA